MSLQFTKMHGLSNDYVYVSLFDQRLEDPGALARAVSDRHRGIGSDGLILVGPADVKEAHARMQMFNSDGSPGEMCGNGIRCMAKLAYERGWARENPMRVFTVTGTDTALLTAAAICSIFRGSLNRAAPAPLDTIFRAGHPKLMSMKSNRLISSITEAAPAMVGGSAP